MANEQNLKPVRTENEAREKGRNGGIKSGESRRRKRDMRQAAKLLLDMPVSRKQSTMRAILDSLGIPEEDSDYRTAVLAAMLLQAGNGNVKAASFLRDTAGDNPLMKIREAELKLKKEEFKFQKEQKLREQEMYGGEETLADAVAAMYEERSRKEEKEE